MTIHVSAVVISRRRNAIPHGDAAIRVANSNVDEVAVVVAGVVVVRARERSCDSRDLGGRSKLECLGAETVQKLARLEIVDGDVLERGGDGHHRCCLRR